MADKKLHVSVSDIETINTPDFSVLFGTIHIGNTKRRKVLVKTSKQFKQKTLAKIMAYCKSRVKK